MSARLRALLSFWFGAWCQWTTALGLFGLLRVLYQVSAWTALRSTASVIAVIAGEIALLIAAAAAIAALVALAWLLAGGLRTPPTRASRAIAALGTAAAALVAIVSLFIGWVWWHHRQSFLSISPTTDLALLAGILLVAILLMARQARRTDGLSALAERLQAPSRRTVLLGLTGSVVAAFGAGLRWCRFDRSAPVAAQAAAAARPNILLVTFDALSAEDMSLYGYALPTTPQMDALASQSIVFERFYAAGNHTTPTVSSLHTGVNVPSHGAFDWMGEVDPAWRPRSLARLLREAGYRTGAVVANPAAHPATLGFAEDYDYLPPPPIRRDLLASWAWHMQGGPLAAEVEELLGERVRKYYARLDQAKLPETDMPPEAVFDQGRAFIAAASGPWFLWLHLMVPHEPYLPPAPLIGAFGSVVNGDTRAWQAGLDGFGPYPPERKPEVERLRRRYNEFIVASDAALGQFIAGLDRDKALANTALLVSSDHGENFEHAYWGHAGPQLWEPVVHVPLLVRLPDGAGAGTRITEVTGQVDLMPTLLDLAGLQPAAWAEGQSLRPLWQGGSLAPALRFSFVSTGTFERPTRKGLIAVHDGPRKYILDLATGTAQLFDRVADPGELQDRAVDFPEDCARYRKAAEAVVARHDQQA